MKRPAMWSAIAVGLLALVFVGILATRKSAASRQADSPLLGKAAPELVGTTIDGKQFRVNDLQGQYVAVNFFASWCVPCQQEHSELERFAQEHAQANDAKVVGVIFDDQVAQVSDFFAKKGGDWPVIQDPNGKVALDFGVRGPPETFLISPQGFVLSRIVGPVDAASLNRLMSQAKRVS